MSEPPEDQTDTETADNPGPPLPPVLAGRFRVGRFLGRGGMGRVFQAMDEKLNVPVALKLLVAELQGSPAFLERLRQEIVITRKVTHPNVCRVYDLGTDGPLSFLTMELIQGQPLDRVLAQGPLPRGQVGEILEQVCLALEAAHREGVVHRDLKPGNVMLDPRGKVTVMDFGLARDIGGASSIRGGPVGTPAYWAPEQARGLPITFRTDLYAVGLIAYEMFAGKSLAHVLGEGASLEEIPGPFRPVVRTCLEVRPERRFESAAMLRRAVHDARASLDSSRSRWRWPLAAAAAGAAALMLGGTLAARAHRQRPVPPPTHSPGPAPPVAVEAARPEPPPPLELPPEAPPERKKVPKQPHDNSKLDRSKIPVFE